MHDVKTDVLLFSLERVTLLVIGFITKDNKGFCSRTDACLGTQTRVRQPAKQLSLSMRVRFFVKVFSFLQSVCCRDGCGVREELQRTTRQILWMLAIIHGKSCEQFHKPGWPDHNGDVMIDINHVS